MKKIVVYLVLCIVFCWSAICVWNYAPELAKACHTVTWVFDSVAAVLVFVALIFSCLCSEALDVRRKQQNEA